MSLPLDLAAGPEDRRTLLRRLLCDADPFCTTLHVWADDTFGPDWLGWHPATVRRECEDALGRPLPDRAFDRLMAGVVLRTTDLFHARARAFVPVANVLAGAAFAPATVDPADAWETSWALAEAALLDPPGPDEPGYSEEVKRYVRAALREDGFDVIPPSVAALAGLDRAEPADLGEAVRLARGEREAGLGRFLAAGVRQVLEQVAELPLTHGDTRPIKKRLEAARGQAA